MMHGQSIASATRVRSTAMTDFSDSCERCGRAVNRKGNRKSGDGIMLCMDCRGVDPQYRKMRLGEGYIETSDEQLEKIESQLQALQREAS